MLKDRRVKKTPKKVLPAEYMNLISRYRNQDSEEDTEGIYYGERDLRNGLIIDITSDQFDDYDNSVYVGQMDEFHQQFSLYKLLIMMD